MTQCGNTFLLLGKFEKANKLLQQALSGLERTVGMDGRDNLNCVLSLAHCLRARGSCSEALALYQRALDGYTATPDPGHPRLLRCASHLANLQSFLQE